jgi:hypothetical protein
MDVDLEPHKAYFQLLKDISHTLDFIMPQYYNGVTRPVLDGIDGTGAGSASALTHYTTIVNEFFGGDATRMVFGFCINDCSGTSSNANGNQAAQVMIDLSGSYSCHGGAFFWVANDDRTGSWSSTVNKAIAASSTCSDTTPSSPPFPTDVPITTSPPTRAPETPSPTDAPVASLPTRAPDTPRPTDVPVPVTNPPTEAPATSSPVSDGPCCPQGFTGLLAYNECTSFYHCVGGAVVGVPTDCPLGLLFDDNMQYCNWAMQVSCLGDAICP